MKAPLESNTTYSAHFICALVKLDGPSWSFRDLLDVCCLRESMRLGLLIPEQLKSVVDQWRAVFGVAEVHMFSGLELVPVVDRECGGYLFEFSEECFQNLDERYLIDARAVLNFRAERYAEIRCSPLCAGTWVVR